MKNRFLTLALACFVTSAILPGAVHAQELAQTAAPEPAPQDDFKPSGKLWGYVFGDYGYKVHADSMGSKRTSPGNQYLGVPKDFSSFALRRVYLGYDYNIARNVSTQLLLAHESDATLTGDSKRAFYIKLANIRWTFAKNTDLVVGSQETPGFPMLEERIWGYRSIEKTITDFRNIISSTDLGASIQGKLNDKGDFGYNLLFSNGTGATPENDIYKKLSADIYAKFLNQKLVVDVYGDYNLSQRQPIEKNKATGKVFIAYTSDPITVGVTVFEQVQTHTVTYSETSVSTQLLKNAVVFGYSAFVRGAIIKNKLNFFARYDNFNPDKSFKNSRIYYSPATTSTYYSKDLYGSLSPMVETFITAGIDWMPAKNVHFMPNIWIDSYMNPAKDYFKGNVNGISPTGKNKMDSDIEARLTFYYIFGKDNANIPTKVN